MQYILYYEYNSNADLLGANISFHDINKRDQIISLRQQEQKYLKKIRIRNGLQLGTQKWFRFNLTCPKVLEINCPSINDIFDQKHKEPD
jgi:hypothetical protein